MPYIKLNKKHFFNNLDIIAKKTKTKDKIALVLKDNAYGHGLLEIASMAKEYGITKAIVRTSDEALKIKSYFKYILVLADTPKDTDDKVRYTINDLDSIKNFPSGTRVELKVDTLMHRNGVSMDEIENALEQIDNHGLILEAVFTHHRSADEMTSEWYIQNENFKKVKQLVEVLCAGNVKFHSANSASLFRTQNFDEDMARVGIAVYGCLASNVVDCTMLKPVLSLLASKNSSRELKKGDRIGYGGAYTLRSDSLVSNYDIGYADGFFRSLSSKYITPNGIEQVGNISMDNASFICDVREILVFDDARKIASDANSIAYEILTSLKADIKRVII